MRQAVQIRDRQGIARVDIRDMDATCEVLQYHAGVKTLLLEDEYEQLKVTATGLKVFERQETKVNLHYFPFNKVL